MEFFDVVLKRRSIRKFTEDKVPAEVLNRVLEAGRWAPSGANRQPWRFIVVTEPDVKAKIADVCTEYSRKVWRNFAPETAKFLGARGGTWDKSYMRRLPVLIAVVYRTTDEPLKEYALASAWAAAENMLLAATNEGLASCVYTHGFVEEETALKRILVVPDDYHLAAVIQLGYAREIPPTPPRKKLEEIVSYEHF
jgi:nitroreductase